MNRTRFGIALAIVLLASQAALAEIIHVPADYSTIQEAIDAAVAGDKVVISSGIYDGFVIDDRQGITVVGKAGSTILEDGEELAAAHVKGSSDITLKKLNVVGSDFGIFVENSHSVDIIRCTVAETTYVGIALLASDVCKVVRNQVEKVFEDDPLGGVGILLGDSSEPGSACNSNVVLRNEVRDCVGDGIRVFGDLNDIARNTLEGNGDSAIDMRSSAGNSGGGGFNIVRLNKILSSGKNGILLRGHGHYATRNTISDVGQDGIQVLANGVVVVKNKIFNAGDDGLSVDVSVGSLFKQNKIFSASQDGVRLPAESTGNTFIKNVAKNSGEWDLAKHVLEEDNTFIGNNFPVSTWPPEEEEENPGGVPD